MVSSTIDNLNLASLWPKSRKLVAPLLVATLCLNLLGLALPLALLQVYDRVLVQFAHESWIVTAWVVLIAALLEAVLRLLRARLAGWCGSQQEQQLTMRLLKHLLVSRSPAINSVSGPADELMTLEALGKLREFSSGQALTVLMEIPFVAIYLALIAYMGGILALIPCGLLLVFSGRVAGQGVSLRNGLKQRDDAEVARRTLLLDVLTKIPTLKALAQIRGLQRRLESCQQHLSAAALSVAQIANQAYQDGLLLGQLMLAGLTIAGAPLVLAGHLSLGALMACVLVAGRLMAPLQRALGLYSRVQEARLAVTRVRDVLQRPRIFGSKTNQEDEHPATLRLHGLGLKDEQGRWLVRQVELQAECGQTYVINTTSGAVGCHLMFAMAGLRAPSEGKVMLNGQQPHQLLSSSLAEQVGYLAPGGAIYRGTIYDNLSRFGQTPRERVIEMVELLDLEPAIAVLPKGFNTPLDGTLADPLPPGLKQRIAMARTLALKPRIILFHQADRALDRAGYNVIYRLLQRLQGKVLLMLLTDDQNLRTLADHTFTQQGTTFRLEQAAAKPLPLYLGNYESLAA